MFEIGTTEHWWEIAKKFPLLSKQRTTLKPLGYAHMVNLIETFKPKRVLEVGHGAGSFLFELFKDKVELWGLDDTIEDNQVLVNELEKTKFNNPHVKFVKGILGNFLKDLPDNYFDLVCSVSVIEHIPEDNLNSVFEDTFRILKPGGIVSHSYDIQYKKNTKAVFDSYVNSNFEWIKPLETMNVFWADWLNFNDIEKIKDLLSIIMFENATNVAEVYMWQVERSLRKAPKNWVTILTAAQKPMDTQKNNMLNGTSIDFENNKLSEIQSVTPENFNNFTYSKLSHFEIFKNKMYDKELYNNISKLIDTDLITYNKLLSYAFIKNNLDKGSKILEIEGRTPEFIDKLKLDYSYTNFVKSKETIGKFSTIQKNNLEIIIGSLDNYNKDIQSNRFDFVFSTANFHYHNSNNFEKISIEINRILKPGGYCMICFVGIMKEPSMVLPNILEYFYLNEKIKNSFIPYLKILSDSDLFVMSEKCYNERWKNITGKNYYSFGKPFSYNILFEKK